jgi:two-component system sensor histidine kinase KdpD
MSMQTGESHDLMSVLGHDLRSPLTAIRGAATLLLQTQGDLEPAKVAELLRLIDSQAGRMADRVEDVLVAGRLDSGTLRVVVEDVDLADVLADVLEAARARSAGRRIRVQVRVEGIIVCADMQRVAQLLRILIDNAVRFSPSGSPIEVRAERTDPGTVRVEVRDRGPGIALQQRERIFERGVKLAGDGPGAGLGLYVAQGLTQAMAGAIGVEPRPGGGSSFWVTLPAK